MRFSTREVAVATLTISIIALVGTVNGSGPFNRPETDLNLILLATFVISVVVTALVMCSILTSRRKDRQSLKQANDILEQRVQQRTADLTQTNMQLQQEIEDRKQIERELATAHEESLAALKTKSQILANVSHDARTPLNIITLYTEMLQRGLHGPLTDKQRESLDIILGSSHELLNFINNLLDEAQLQSKRIKAVYQLTHVADWMNSRMQYFKKLAERKNLTLDVIYGDALPPELYLDTESLKQILDNLVSNALKFTKQGGITLHATRKDDAHWQLCISDTGTGIPQDALQHLFDPFWQLDSSTTREVNRGVGLGLSIVRQRIDLLNGTIDVTSEEGRGTTFTLTLPIVQPDTESTDERKQNKPAPDIRH
jgi:signal transduction histidine kinase